MSGSLLLLLSGGSGFAASTHAMTVGIGGLFSQFYSYSAFGYAVDAFGHIYSPGSGSFTPTTRQTVPIAEVAYWVTSIGTYGMTCDFVWTTTAGLASQIKFDGISYLMSDGGLVSTASSAMTISIASPCVVTWTSHGAVNGTMVMFTTTGALPTGITPNTIYYVVNAATNTFQVSLTSGGAAINTSGTQSGTHTGYIRPRRRFNIASPPATSPWWCQGALSATASAANPTTWTSTGHGLIAGRGVTFSTTGSLPSGLVSGTRYFVINATSNTFQVSTTVGGAAVGNGASQSGTHSVSRSIDVVIS